MNKSAPFWVIIPEHFWGVRCSFKDCHRPILEVLVFELAGSSGDWVICDDDIEQWSFSEWQDAPRQIEGELQYGTFDWRTSDGVEITTYHQGISRLFGLFETIFEMGKQFDAMAERAELPVFSNADATPERA